MSLTSVLSLALLAAASSAPGPARGQVTVERPQALGAAVLNGRVPLVRLTVGGTEGVFLLDTGATQTVLTPAFAAGLPAAAAGTVQGRDSAQASVSGARLGGVVITAPGLPPREAGEVVVAEIAALQRLGLSGVFSPQSLLSGGCLRLDFAAGTLAYAPLADTACAPEPGDAPATVAADGRPKVSARVGDAGRTVVFLIDSGAGQTVLAAADAEGLAERGGGQTQSATGAVSQARRLGPVRLAFGDRRLELASVVVREPLRQPLLGMDALQSAVLVVRADGRAALRLPAPARARLP